MDANKVGIPSQNYESAFDAYDARGADDFTLATPCTVVEVDAAGVYEAGSGPVDSFHVTFYRNHVRKPGGQVANQDHLTYTDAGSGSPQILLSTPVPLEPGTYWVSIKANMDFSLGGNWRWGTNKTVRGHVARWRSPGDAWGSGCTAFQPVLTCFRIGEGGDFAFQLDQ